MPEKDILARLQQAIRQSPMRGKIRKVSLFGSRLHGDARKDSDIDLLVDVADTMGLFEFIGLKLYLERVLGTSVDLVETEALSKYLKDDVVREAEVLYEA